MKQIITIAKVGGNAGKQLLKELHDGANISDIRARIYQNRENYPVLFYCEYIDRWSMGDIFKAFIYPKKPIHEFYQDGNELFCIDSSVLKLKKKPMQFDEYEWLYTNLNFAKKCFSKLECGAHIFLIRTVVGLSDRDNPELVCNEKMI